MAEKNAEIWSTRLQRELLALTTDDAPAETKDEVAVSLPPFVSVKGHKLDIANGECSIAFLVDLPAAKTKGPVPVESSEATSTTEENEAKKEEETAQAQPKEDAPLTPIVIELDVSLKKKADGSVDTISIAYPFLKPVASLQSGYDRFPAGSTIKDGDLIEVETDWTPSLHLTDAVLNVALKIKESLLQSEPFHASAETVKQDPVEEIVSKAKRFGSSFSKGLRGLAEKATEKADALQSPRDDDGKPGLRLGRNKRKSNSKPKAKAGEIRIGDEINMLEAPWVDCQGVYSCKAIRRPAFVEEAIAVAAQNTEPEQVAGAGFAGAGAMFRNFTQSARSVLEESFLMITDTHILEMRSSKLNLSTGVVTFAIPVEMMAKLKFRRQESISLFFKPAPDDPLIYMCPDSADAVHQIQAVLKRHGVKGKHTNAATHRAINQALHLVQEIQTKELALKHDPSVERVNEIMDLYRQAAERFEVAGDVRHEEVVTHMRKFLALPLTVSILDGSYQKPDNEAPISVRSSPDAAAEGVVLERTDDGDYENETETPHKVPKPRSSSEDRAFEENMDTILKEAEEDLADLNVDDDDFKEMLGSSEFQDSDVNIGEGTETDDAIADFENMLKEADNELAELMNS